MLEVHEGLLHESVGDVGVIVVRGVVVSAQAELALRSRDHGVVRQAQNRRLFSFDEPIKLFAGLPNSNAQQGIPQAVVAVSGVALEPVPALGARAPVDRNLERTNLVLWRRDRC